MPANATQNSFVKGPVGTVQPETAQGWRYISMAQDLQGSEGQTYVLNYVDLVITLTMESHNILQVLGACMFFSPFGCTIVYRGQTYLLYGYLEDCRGHSRRAGLHLCHRPSSSWKHLFTNITFSLHVYLLAALCRLHPNDRIESLGWAFWILSFMEAQGFCSLRLSISPLSSVWRQRQRLLLSVILHCCLPE